MAGSLLLPSLPLLGPLPSISDGSVTPKCLSLAATMETLSLPFIFSCLIKRNEPESEKDDTGEIKMESLGATYNELL